MIEEPPSRLRTRAAARVLLLDEGGRILLLQGRDVTRPGTGTWWFTPGGGIAPGESPQDAARRELLEETGITVDRLVGPVHHRTTEFDFEDTHYRQSEAFFLARLSADAPVPTRLSDVERRSLLGQRWWDPAELAASGVTVYPERLVEILADAVAERGVRP